jgi:hypothetical protein
MMLRVYIVLLIIFISCESKTKYKRPENLIPREQMIDLLVDMHIATGASDVKDKDNERNRNYMILVFEKYQIDSARFAESNFYYTSNIVEYEDIFKEVKKQLIKIQDQYRSNTDSMAKKTDSIRAKQKIPKRLREDDIVR